MSRLVTVSTVQTPSGAEGDNLSIKQKNVGWACEMLSEAGRRASDIALLPEIFPLINIPPTRENFELFADELYGEISDRLSTIARTHHMYVLAPVLARRDGQLYNCTWIIDRDGALLGEYDKVHPTQGEISLGVIPGNQLPVFRLDCGTIGVMTCHDNSFPETARCLALDGAEIVFWPHVQSGWGDIAWDAVYYRSRTIDNHIYLVAACPGTPEGRAWMPGMMVGRSAIVGHDGFPLAEVGRHPGVATATIDLDRPRIVGSFTREGDEGPYWQYVLQDRRPEVYGALTRGNRKRPDRGYRYEHQNDWQRTDENSPGASGA
jgi:predicted amidohydrolase